eukprot:CAMPEP_0176459264 /NCGR_PEP_ID=MMETSP0127-20121128/33149_1 /TAXON_ID=938130 /ORGANISM="Platyophrya macrostoma, Strain WH" /LENGTH=80 /DNA_ID=CAMNT_0017850119 /DNA_START=56 /DNA_END=295 /DNA_ORIENTATION=+
MNDALFGRFIDPATNIPLQLSKVVQNVKMRGVETQIIVLPKLVEYAREYFACDSLMGIELENQGGEGTIGSHWERRILGD